MWRLLMEIVLLLGTAFVLGTVAQRLKQSANIILTTVTDIMGFFAFLGFAVLFQDYLVA